MGSIPVAVTYIQLVFSSEVFLIFRKTRCSYLNADTDVDADANAGA